MEQRREAGSGLRGSPRGVAYAVLIGVGVIVVMWLVTAAMVWVMT